ncbi:hypothetical protein GND95_08685 [Defluviitalea raffinosedens]|uniref:Uncharacterized protein n=1 Tax=Defluviitalea raffinosedens TaxID=1450156 RepID=A0A7C8HE78_9FIRM|nr:hypothetical protein [Defluviitalea raffinosedens]KAE9633721.1 hypothetical protein GND95_08685 [Defluviitalea raffinosedens]
MLQPVKERLASFGYIASTDDEWLINFMISKVTSEIKTSCNIDIVPSYIEPMVIDIVAGELLTQKKAMGQDIGSINFEAVAKTIKIGDTSVELDGGINIEARFNSLISELINGNRKTLISSLRRIDW